MKKWVLLLGVFLLSAQGGCASKSAQRDPNAGERGGARVQEAWQKAFLQLLEEEKGQEVSGWGVLTYSGWSDSGQFFMMQSGSQKKFYRVAENTKAGTSVVWQKFAASLKTVQQHKIEKAAEGLHALGDLASTAYDGLEIEYIHARKVAGRVEVDKRVYMHAPNDAAGKKHATAADTFFKAIAMVK